MECSFVWNVPAIVQTANPSRNEKSKKHMKPLKVLILMLLEYMKFMIGSETLGMAKHLQLIGMGPVVKCGCRPLEEAKT